MTSHFDRQLGADVLRTVPTGPGVYQMFDASGALVYVGKATNLRRRLTQYRNATRRKKHRKMRRIVADAVRIDVVPCETALAAELLEARLIREQRPRWNVAGAFSFLYPLIGLGEGRDGELLVAFSTRPEERHDVEWFGAYESREVTMEAFYAWVRLLARIGHRTTEPRARGMRTYAFAIRQLPATLRDGWPALLRGEDRSALDALLLMLLERASARRDAAEVARDLKAMQRFYRSEAVALRRARELGGHEGALVTQADRDELFIRARNARNARSKRRAQHRRA